MILIYTVHAISKDYVKSTHGIGAWNKDEAIVGFMYLHPGLFIERITT